MLENKSTHTHSSINVTGQLSTIEFVRKSTVTGVTHMVSRTHRIDLYIILQDPTRENVEIARQADPGTGAFPRYNRVSKIKITGDRYRSRILE